MSDPTMMDIEQFSKEARAWLRSNAPVPTDHHAVSEDLDLSVFHALAIDDERTMLDQIRRWLRLLASQGYHAVSWPSEYGGLGLTRAHAVAFGRVAREFETPPAHELISVTTNLVANTLRIWGTDEQRDRFIPGLLTAETLCCQLFSEPGAGSDLASLACRANRDGDEWTITGQKVWSSGAHFADWGLLLARTDPDLPKHKGITAFMLPLSAEGVEIRPIRQMSGGASFGEVFLSDVRIPDSLRIGECGAGWNVSLTTLGFERDHSSSGAGSGSVGGSWSDLLETARAHSDLADPVLRQDLMKAYTQQRVESLLNRRAAQLARSGTPGPEGSLGKLMWTERMRCFSDVAGRILGPKLIADSGERAAFAWGEHVLGAPGYRIAGGSDEVQRNIIGERVLGLPGEPRIDKDSAWRDVPR